MEPGCADLLGGVGPILHCLELTTLPILLGTEMTLGLSSREEPAVARKLLLVRDSSLGCWVSLATKSWAKPGNLAKQGSHSQEVLASAFYPLDPSAPNSMLPRSTGSGPSPTDFLPPSQSAGLHHFSDPGLGFCGSPIFLDKDCGCALPLPALAAALWPD